MEPNEGLREARRQLFSIGGFELIEDFKWDIDRDRWVLKFQLNGSYIPTDFVPEITEWYCTIADTYPYGKIDIYPSKENGIIHTFPHQTYNGLDDKTPWRLGNICVNTSVGLWGHQYFNEEPYDNTRLFWHINRCILWIEAASKDELFIHGEPFELPSFIKDPLTTFVFNETEVTYSEWAKIKSMVGTAQYKIPFRNRAFPITTFWGSGSEEVSYQWGKHINSESKNLGKGLWIRLPKMPIQKPWQMPLTWGELFQVLNDLGIDLKSTLVKAIFKNPSSFYAFIGFPIPKINGEEPSRLHWFAFKVPDIPFIKGFRKNSQEQYIAQSNIMFKANGLISWVNTENWNKEDITARGILPTKINSRRYTIVGAGAIGSHLSEALVRAGCDNLKIVDDDITEIGNLTRHTLTVDYTYNSKALGLVDRLNKIAPSANISAIFKKANSVVLNSLIKETDVFIDATGSDEVLKIMSDTLKEENKILISVSAGIGIKRLYCFMAQTGHFDIAAEFQREIQTWLKKDQSENPNPEFPREGVGCWHPVFPGRLDHILMLLSPVLSQIEQFLESKIEKSMTVIQKNISENGELNSIEIKKF